MVRLEEIHEDIDYSQYESFTQVNALAGLSSNVFDRRRLQGYELPYREINDLTGGVRTSTLTVLGGATGMGKSLLSLNFAVALAQKDVKVCYIDLENGLEEGLERVARIWFGLTQDFFEKEENEEQFSEMLQDIKNIEYLSHEMINKMKVGKKITSFQQIKIMIENRARKGVKIVFIDPLQALEEEIDSSRNINEQGKIIKDLKELAQLHNLAIVVNHHIRKSTYSGGQFLNDLDDVEPQKYRIPSLDDLKGSAKISDYATDVWAMVRTIGASDDIQKGKTLFRVLKSRKKGLGDVRLYLDLDTLKFYERINDFNENYVDAKTTI